ncbi:hypothetical protein Tco_0299339 [Tanacetum coccineum]
MAKTINGEEQLHALVDGKKIIITESSVRKDLQLANEEDEAVYKELGGVPRCQETMRDTTAQTRLKLDELMALCTTLQNKVLDLEHKKTTQHNKIASLKRMVKKIEKKNRSRTHRLKRLYKVGLTARVESSDNEESLGEDASKQGRIDAIDADEDITLVSVHDVNVFAVSTAGDTASTASAATTVSAATTTTVTTVDDITLAQVLEGMKSTKPKMKGVVIQELGESTTTKSSQLSSQQSQDKGKGILIEPIKPMKKKDQIRLDEETALNLQAEFDKEERFTREKAKKEKEVNIALIETWDDIQAKIDANHQLAERMQAQEQEELSIKENATLFQQLLEKRRKNFIAKRAEEKRNKPPTKAQQRKIIAFKRQKVEEDKETAELKQLMEIIPDKEEVAIDVIPLAIKSPSIIGWKIHKEGRKSYYQIMRADGKSQIGRLGFNLGDLKTMFEPHVEDKVLRNQQDYKVLDWKLYDSYGVHSLRMQHMQIYILVKKKYPLAPLTLSMMLEKKLMIDYESEMAYQLLKFIMKQLKK